MVRPCEKNERGAHSEKNTIFLCVNMREKKERTAKPTVERCVQERFDRGGAERGHDNKQGSMEEYDHQLYRRSRMTGQARDEEEEEKITLQRVYQFRRDPSEICARLSEVASFTSLSN